MKTDSRDTITKQETFDISKLAFIVKNWDKLDIDGIRKTRGGSKDSKLVKAMCEKYLENATIDKTGSGVINVSYNQLRGQGRYFAAGAVSLQGMSREIRHTIAREYYYDVDIVNAHPVILRYILSLHGKTLETLDEFIDDRDQILKNTGLPRDEAKAMFLAIINSEDAPASYTKFLKTATDEQREFPERFFKVMNKIKAYLAKKYKSEYDGCLDRLEDEGREHNAKGKFINSLLCDVENSILLALHDILGKPANCVLCFDGIMLPKSKYKSLDILKKKIRKAQNQINEDFAGNSTGGIIHGLELELAIKPMNSHIVFNEDIPQYKGMEFEYTRDYTKIIGKRVSFQTVINWSKTIKALDNEERFIITTAAIDKRTGQKYPWYKFVGMRELMHTYNKAIYIVNDKFDPNYKAPDKLRLTPSEKKEKDEKGREFMFSNLADAFKFLYTNNFIESFQDVLFRPFLSRKDNFDCGDYFNTFRGFRMEHYTPNKILSFKDSNFYSHIKNEMCSDEGEFEHLLDHMADIVQDPANVKGIAHLFKSRQGCGKGLLLRLMATLLGSEYTAEITNIDDYFNSSFNAHHSTAILKVFEELKSKGSSHKNHDRLKGEITGQLVQTNQKFEKIKADKNTARYWFFTNEENALFLEPDDRRFTLHEIKGTYAQDDEYFAPIIDELNDLDYIKAAFEFLAEREYKYSNVRKVYNTSYKSKQIEASLPTFIHFLKDFAAEYNYGDINNIPAHKVKSYFDDFSDYHKPKTTYNAVLTQMKTHIGMEVGTVRIDGTPTRCHKFKGKKLIEHVREYLKDPKFEFEQFSRPY